MDKPPYRVPLMEEVRQIPWNGLKVASTFSGAGGSCTGYRMAGYKVVWANEFVPIAQESYKANADPSCHLDCRDIKQVQAEDILKATGLAVGELDLFDGSPPCQAFSTAGKREKGWGTDKKYAHGAKQKNETLFDEYIRLLRGLKPKVFVAENVSGLVKGTAKGFFLEILAALKAAGPYRVSCRVVDAKWLGVPQSRLRTIFVGVREDLGIDPVHPEPLPYLYSVLDAIPWLSSLEYARGEKKPGSNWDPYNKVYDIKTEPAGTITSTEDRNIKVSGMIEQHNCHGGTRKTPLSSPSPSVTAMGLGAKRRGEVTINVTPVEPEANIERFAIGDEWDKIKPGENSKKYFSLCKPDPNQPSPTILASHGTSSIAGVTPPVEKRKFTIQELKRICAFPDDFILCGSYGQQWERLGNSVPPLMMRAIAETIRDKILLPSLPSKLQ